MRCRKYNPEAVEQSSCTDVNNGLLSSRQLKTDQSPGTTDIQLGEPWAVLELLTGAEMSLEQRTHHQSPSQQRYSSGDRKAGKWELTYKLRAAQGAHEQVFLRSLAGRNLFQVS